MSGYFDQSARLIESRCVVMPQRQPAIMPFQISYTRHEISHGWKNIISQPHTKSALLISIWKSATRWNWHYTSRYFSQHSRFERNFPPNAHFVKMTIHVVSKHYILEKCEHFIPWHWYGVHYVKKWRKWGATTFVSKSISGITQCS